MPNHKYTSNEIARFWSKVDKPKGDDGCWLFASSSVKGHGRITMNGKVEQAYRVSYKITHGHVDDGTRLFQTCDTPFCVNPKHLQLEKPAVERFWLNVEVTSAHDCWEWQAGRNKHGYGYMRWEKNRTEKAHRIAWILAYGNIPEGLEVCHACDNPSCCNPTHLLLGSHAANIRDMIAKGRLVNPHGEKHGESKFTDAQVAEVRRVYAHGALTYKQAGEVVGMAASTAYGIIKGLARRGG